MISNILKARIRKVPILTSIAERVPEVGPVEAVMSLRWGVAAYETIDGSPVDPDNPYENRDPRLGFTAVLPGSYFWAHTFLITRIREVRLIMPVIG